MSAFERKISFLNRYFIYKKIREVNTEKVELELGEYEEFGVIRNAKETIQAISIAKDEVEKVKPKIRKLSKKLLLVAATEAIDEPLPVVVIIKVDFSSTTPPKLNIFAVVVIVGEFNKPITPVVCVKL